MRRFKFSLATVLRVKRSLEEKVTMEYSAILERRSRAVMNLQTMLDLQASMNEAQSGTREGLIDLASQQLFEASRRASVESVTLQRGRIAEIEVALEAKRLEVVAAARETKVLEKLEEAQYKVHLEKLNREEQAFLDELASHRSLA